MRPPSGCGDSALQIRDSVPPRAAYSGLATGSKAEPESIAGKKADCTPEHKETLRSEVQMLVVMARGAVESKSHYPNLSPRIDMLLRNESDALCSIEVDKGGQKMPAYQALVECQSDLLISSGKIIGPL